MGGEAESPAQGVGEGEHTERFVEGGVARYGEGAGVAEEDEADVNLEVGVAEGERTPRGEGGVPKLDPMARQRTVDWERRCGKKPVPPETACTPSSSKSVVPDRACTSGSSKRKGGGAHLSATNAGKRLRQQKMTDTYGGEWIGQWRKAFFRWVYSSRIAFNAFRNTPYRDLQQIALRQPGGAPLPVLPSHSEIASMRAVEIHREELAEELEEMRQPLWTYRVPFIGTTATPCPDPPPPEPSVPTLSPSITVTSPRQFAHFIRQDDVTFFMVDVTDLLHYDPLCPDAELIPLEPDPPSISMAPISTSVPPPSVESTPPSRADVDAEELAQYMANLEPAVRDLIREYHDVFPSSFSYAGIPPMRDVEHSIQLVADYCVHHQAPYRLSIPEATKLKRQLEELLRLGFIKPSNSPWGAPVLFARKADGTLCLCIDYRGLNRYTVKNSYPMPRSDELFDRLAGNRFFTKIDLRSGYHQILVAAADQPKTAFRSRFGHYEFTVMPFGLTNAPATFQRAMNDIFRDILEQYVLVYLDDILVYSRTLEEHLRHLRDVLDCLRRHGFYAKLSKCRFAQHKVNFLGHYVSDQGLYMDDAKITAIAEWPAPTSAKQLRSFLGLTSYYSNFIRGYARYSYVLTSTLLRKNPPLAWTPLHEDAFHALKKAVTCAPVLHLPDFDRPFILTTDASDFVVGAVLSQVFPSSPDSSHPRIPYFPPLTPHLTILLTDAYSSTRPATDEPSIDHSPTIAEDGTVESR
ncbi:hypothetical protein CBR_g40848 [Chara braunii]|uniref:Reverse transcriptase domain-containing protein n=1 Tax=Chara braunii TaxID=69332 RepID=A0A388K299_CHABU|nr:hypothetical protein CBR_g40848 [Chara braunii]|eukprot:GBG64149.1 hypothetical protein CBR_g40848 [Chara braunii]